MQLTQNTDTVMEEVTRAISLNIDNFELNVIVKVRKSEESGYPKVYKWYKYSKDRYTYDIQTHDDIVLWSDTYDIIANRILNRTIKDISWRKFNDCMYIHNNILNPKT